jgi:hypothetical protein
MKVPARYATRSAHERPTVCRNIVEMSGGVRPEQNYQSNPQICQSPKGLNCLAGSEFKNRRNPFSNVEIILREEKRENLDRSRLVSQSEWIGPMTRQLE